MALSSLSSTLEAIKQLLEPEAKEMLSKIIENSDEEIKKPNSRARRLLDSFIAMILNISIVEQAMAEIQARVAQVERFLSEKAHGPRPEPSAGFGTREEEELKAQNEQAQIKGLQILLVKLYDDIKELKLRRGRVVEQLNGKLGELDEEKAQAMQATQQFMSQNYGVNLTNNHVAQVANLYTNRTAAQTGQLSTLKKAMQPSLQPIPYTPVAKGTEELAEERAYHAERFSQFANLGQSYSVATHVQLVGLLKEELGSGIRMEVILILANRLGGTEENYQKLRMDIQQQHEKTIKEIDNLTQKLNGIISDLENGLGRKATINETCGSVVKAKGELDDIRTPTLGY